MSYTSRSGLPERETKPLYMNQPLRELHPWDTVADMCGTFSQAPESDVSHGHLCTAHTSLLMQSRAGAKAFLPLLCTPLSAYPSQWGIRAP